MLVKVLARYKVRDLVERQYLIQYVVFVVVLGMVWALALGSVSVLALDLVSVVVSRQFCSSSD